jgi:tripartite-type tricarboxylate transporter receptor subunit TctC
MRRLINSLIVALGLALVAGASAQYPERPVTYVIPFDPGGESDTTARMQQQALEEALGTKITITNKAGGGGAVAWSDFQRNAKPTGYEIIGVNIPHIIVQPLQRADAGYETEGFEFIQFFQFTPNAVIVDKDSPFQTLEDLLAFAKENPGAVTMGGSGSQSANHIGALLLEQEAGVDVTYVPFTGTGAAVPALLGGHVGALMSYTPVAVQYSDEVRTLAVASEERPPFLSEVPTLQELGYDVVIGAYRGVAAPEGTPDEVMQTLIEAFEQVTEEIRDKQEELGFVVTNISGDQAAQLVERNKATFREILESLQ